ncbi:chloride channel protein [Geoglobus acetivorans]|uniref:Chloride channel protein n=1 Tax=Geoglobus acetivorans TaxID=565033 RepID=A0A0A7GDG1_GEOAI|nr:Chloride channel protein [Geoglobus acetivorans]
MRISYSKGHFLFLVVLTGIVSGLGAIALYLLIDMTNAFFVGSLGNLTLPTPAGEPEMFSFSFSGIRIPYYILPAIGGLLSGYIVYTFAPEAEGHGTDAVIKAFHRERGVIRARVPFVKALATAFTIGTGGSAGREGPIAQIGAGFGSVLSTFFDLSDRERRILLISGVAGGIGAIFRSPLGGALFAVEVLYRRDTETEGLIYAFLSSIISYTVFVGFLYSMRHSMPTSIFATPSFALTGFEEVPFFALTGLLSAIVGIVYIKTFYSVHNIFKNLKMKSWMKPVAGGLLTGAIIYLIPPAMGMSYGYVQLAIDGKLTVIMALSLLFGKILATSFTVGSGGSGGVFAPSIVIGSMVGALTGFLAQSILPDCSLPIGAFVLVGMGAFISAIAKTPIASIIMVLEMSGGYELLPAIMTASAISYLLSGNYSIYSEQVDTRADSPAHRREMIKDVLENLTVREAMSSENLITVSPNNSVDDVLQLIQLTGHLGFPVVDEGKLIGVITLSDINRVSDEMKKNIKVEDIMTRNPLAVKPDENLEKALKLLIAKDIGRLMVVDDAGRLLGIITRSDIMKAHAKELTRLGL